MPEFLNSDGSGLAGALGPSGIGQALRVDASGALLINSAATAQSIAGTSFSASTGRQTAASAITAGVAIFNPLASGKTILLYDIHYVVGNNSFNEIRTVAVDPAFGTPMTAVNNRVGSVIASIATLSFANTNQVLTGTIFDTIGGATNNFLQAIQNGKLIVLPPGQGLAMYVNINGANNWCVSASWSEI